MTLQGSGPISMNDINVELGRSGTATIGLNQAESGTYAAINTASTSRPNGSTPNSMNEWYGYNHNAVTLYSQSVQTMSNIYECCGSANNTKYSTCSTVTTGCTMYNTNDTSSPYASGAFQDINTGYVFTTNGSGVVDAQYGCYC
jgi:hypothetical protein